MKKTGVLFNIQRFCIHDGPGIRSTVFLKGCPLSCKWCHNPESQQSTIQLSYNNNLCKQCARCAKVCKNDVHTFSGNQHTIDFSACTACGTCSNACPSSALELIGDLYTVDSVMDVVLKDLDYYKTSGGGITLSGGEPLYQPAFCMELLKASKQNGLHTCMETCGFCKETMLLGAIQYVDLFLFDFKVWDEVLHQKYTGAPLSPILDNLTLLDQNNASVILRCPIIPEINDNPDHFHAIANLSKLNCVQAVELMPYHTMGVEKSSKIGATYSLDKPYATAEQVSIWQKQLLQLDCQKFILK